MLEVDFDECAPSVERMLDGMVKKVARVAILMGVAALLAGGCATNTAEPQADISVKNETMHSLDEVTIVWDRKELRCGHVSAGGFARVYEAGVPKGATSQVAHINFVEDRTRHPRNIVVDVSRLAQQTGSYQATFAIKSLTNAEVIIAPKQW